MIIFVFVLRIFMIAFRFKFIIFLLAVMEISAWSGELIQIILK